MGNWNDILIEIKRVEVRKLSQPSPTDSVRRKYSSKLFKLTGRNVITYYSAWQTKPNEYQKSILDADKNGFMMAVHNLDPSKGLDLLLHTPGGESNATESIIHYLKTIFGNDIRAIVPLQAMSAGTVIACACKEILMGKHSCLGPIDPQVRGVPAHGVIEEFKTAVKEVKKDPSKEKFWLQIIGKYHPTFLGDCKNAIKKSNKFAKELLEENMFDGDPDAQAKIKKILEKLTDYKQSHSNHIHFDECKNLGLKVSNLEDDQTLQDAVLSLHHANVLTVTNTTAVKIIENHLGKSYIIHPSPQK